MAQILCISQNRWGLDARQTTPSVERFALIDISLASLVFEPNPIIKRLKLHEYRWTLIGNGNGNFELKA